MTHDHDRDITAEFLNHVRKWIDQRGEVLVVLRYLRMAGAKDFALCPSFADFDFIVDSAPLGTDIEVLRDAGLPVRGIVDAAFIDTAVSHVRDDEEYLVLTTEKERSCLTRSARWDLLHVSLRADLNDLLGVEVRMGACPDFMCADQDGLISASKGGINGPR